MSKDCPKKKDKGKGKVAAVKTTETAKIEEVKEEPKKDFVKDK